MKDNGRRDYTLNSTTLGPTNGVQFRARLAFLPKYSPDLNPIEQVFAKFKTLLRKAGARSYEAVSQACAHILTQYPPEECAAYIRNAGYA